MCAENFVTRAERFVLITNRFQRRENGFVFRSRSWVRRSKDLERFATAYSGCGEGEAPAEAFGSAGASPSRSQRRCCSSLIFSIRSAVSFGSAASCRSPSRCSRLFTNTWYITVSQAL